MFQVLAPSSAVGKDFFMVFWTVNDLDSTDELAKIHNKFVLMCVSLLLEDIGQTGLQFVYYERFATGVDLFTLINAIFMVRQSVSSITKTKF